MLTLLVCHQQPRGRACAWDRLFGPHFQASEHTWGWSGEPWRSAGPGAEPAPVHLAKCSASSGAQTSPVALKGGKAGVIGAKAWRAAKRMARHARGLLDHLRHHRAVVAPAAGLAAHQRILAVRGVLANEAAQHSHRHRRQRPAKAGRAQIGRNGAVATNAGAAAPHQFLGRAVVVFGCAKSFASLRTARRWRPAPFGLVHDRAVHIQRRVAAGQGQVALDAGAVGNARAPGRVSTDERIQMDVPQIPAQVVGLLFDNAFGHGAIHLWGESHFSANLVI